MSSIYCSYFEVVKCFIELVVTLSLSGVEYTSAQIKWKLGNGHFRIKYKEKLYFRLHSDLFCLLKSILLNCHLSPKQTILKISTFSNNYYLKIKKVIFSENKRNSYVSSFSFFYFRSKRDLEDLSFCFYFLLLLNYLLLITFNFPCFWSFDLKKQVLFILKVKNVRLETCYCPLSLDHQKA